MPEFGKLVNFQFLSLKIGQKNLFMKPHLSQKSVLQAALLSKYQISMTLKNLRLIHSTSPHFRPFGLHTLPKLKLITPWNMGVYGIIGLYITGVCRSSSMLDSGVLRGAEA